jgi:hypothetical protein
MAVKIDFNNPNILRGHLEQALPQYGLHEEGILVGAKGGLACSLFRRPYDIIRDFKGISSFSNMSALRAYFDAVQGFVQFGSEHAKKFGFGLVTADTSDRIITNGLDFGSNAYYAGIGDENIENAERLERFLEMVKEGHPEIERRCDKVEIMGSSFRLRD